MAICIPTNGWSHKGVAAMGGGVARAAAERFPGCDAALGILLEINGNHTQLFWHTPKMIAFPTIPTHEDPSRIELMERSARELVEVANWNPLITEIYLVRMGCGIGGMDWNEVQPLLASILVDDKFVIVHD